MNINYLTRTLFISVLLIAGCSDDKPEEMSSKEVSSIETATTQTPETFSGSIIGTFDSGGYTYLHISTGRGQVWAAGPITALQRGDNVSFVGKMLMKDFHATSMNRDFAEIYFVSDFTVISAAPVVSSMAQGMGSKIDAHTKYANPHQTSPFKSMPQKPFTRAENGQTIAEILADTTKFKGKDVKIRGRVIKYTSDVMGKNWVHIQDSGTQNDLTITTTAETKIDDVVLIEGKLELNKDYGQGFVYEVVIDNAKLSIE